MREMECTRWCIGRCVVLRVQVGWFVGGVNASWVVVSESASASASGDTERFVRKWSDSCHQHA
jgi:hypothetical protein